MIFGQLTDVGRKRHHNEDNLAVSSFEIAYQGLRGLFHVGLVCDGMGGAAGGEVASAIAVEALLRSIYTSLVNVHMDKTIAYLEPQKILEGAVQAANLAVYQEAHSRPGFSGMGCTATVLLAGHGRIFFAQVGDSRGYQLRQGTLRQVTHDHSFVSELLREGRITAEEAESHPRRSVITRAIGSRPEVEPDVFEVVLQAGDLFLVCSDGLSGMVSDPEIETILGGISREPTEGDLEQASRRLIDAANMGGGTDNISVVLAAVQPQDVPARLFDPIPLAGPGTTGVLTWHEACLRGIPDVSFTEVPRGRKRPGAA